MPTSKLPKSFTTVTPLSKALAMLLFILLPFLGFYLGTKYQKALDDAYMSTLVRMPVKISQKMAPPSKIIITKSVSTEKKLTQTSYTIQNNEQVEKLYSHLIQLTDFSSSMRNCPSVFYTNYRLDFYSEATLVLSSDVIPTGCAKVIINNTDVKSAMDEPGKIFLSDLQSTLNLSSDAFYGTNQ